MADSSALFCSSIPCFANHNRRRASSYQLSISWFARISPKNYRFSRLIQCKGFPSKDADDSNWFDDDQFGIYPWENSNSESKAIHWVHEDRVTLFTADGLMQIGGSLVPQQVPSSNVVASEKVRGGGLLKKLIMTVAMPLLWGVPPASDTLHFAVRSGGGIVEKLHMQIDTEVVDGTNLILEEAKGTLHIVPFGAIWRFPKQRLLICKLVHFKSPVYI